MQLTNQTKLLLTVAVVVLLVYFLYKNNNDAVHNDGKLEYNKDESAKVNVVLEEEHESLPVNMSIETDSHQEIEEETVDESAGEESLPEHAQVPEEKQPVNNGSAYLKRKFNRRNMSKDGLKKINYAEGKRNESGSWSKYFDDNNNLIKNSHDSGNFHPMDETKGDYATFKPNKNESCGSGKSCSPEDLFDVDKMLPQEVNDDWFDVQPEPVSVKNRHLINVTKPIGVNTIGTSRKNAGYDVRGTVPCPKFTVSPWNQSSIDPDNMLRTDVF